MVGGAKDEYDSSDDDDFMDRRTHTELGSDTKPFSSGMCMVEQLNLPHDLQSTSAEPHIAQNASQQPSMTMGSGEAKPPAMSSAVAAELAMQYSAMQQWAVYGTGSASVIPSAQASSTAMAAYAAAAAAAQHNGTEPQLMQHVGAASASAASYHNL